MRKGLKILKWSVIIFVVTQLLAFIPFKIFAYFSESYKSYHINKVFGFPFPVMMESVSIGECGTPSTSFVPQFYIINFISITIATFLIYFIIRLIKTTLNTKQKTQ